MLRSDLGPWRNRKAAWKDLGLDSARGREHVTTYRTDHAWGAAVMGRIGGVSTFDPVLTEASYTWYCPPEGRILDPFAGGSVRGLVAANLGYDYTGIDLSAGQLAANEDQADEWNSRGLLAGTATWLHGDAAEVLPTMAAGEYDYVFTCPPYHSLERYSDDPADLSAMRWPKFSRAYRSIIAASLDRLAEDRFSTWVVGEVRNSAGTLRGLVPLTIAAHEAAGARLYNDGVLLTPIGSAAARMAKPWAASRKVARIHQYVLTFVKGDPKRATCAISGDETRRRVGPATAVPLDNNRPGLPQ